MYRRVWLHPHRHSRTASTDSYLRAPINGIQIVPHAAAPDFSLTLSPFIPNCHCGKFHHLLRHRYAAQTGFTGTVTSRFPGLPTGATATFSPASIPRQASSTLTITTASATTPGTSVLTATGASGTLSHTATASLVVNAPSVAAAPTFSPAAGSYSSPQSVALSDSTSGASIYYTTDGSTPTTASTKYSGAISVAATTTIKAIASATGFSNSAVASATFTINASSALIPQTGWTLKYVDSQETAGENSPATNAFDGNPNTFWHTAYATGDAPLPHEIQISLGASRSITGFTYLPRQDTCTHGYIKQYEFYVSSDGVNWGTPVASGTLDYGTFTYACPGGTVSTARVVSFAAVSGFLYSLASYQ